MYESYFHLSAKPFQLSPDVRFFFPSKEHRRALSFLQYGLSQGDGFIVITGEAQFYALSGVGVAELAQAIERIIASDTNAVVTTHWW